MTDQPVTRQRPVTAPGNIDLGIGYCYRCIQYLTIRDLAGGGPAVRYVPRFAAVMAPWPMPELGTVLVLGACYDCLTGRGEAGQAQSGLIAVNGKVPGL